MENVKIWEAVNSCETSRELSIIILLLADDEGMIQGRTKKFNATKMNIGLDMFMKDEIYPNVLTREYGIRQQAMYIKHYTTSIYIKGDM